MHMLVHLNISTTNIILRLFSLTCQHVTGSIKSACQVENKKYERVITYGLKCEIDYRLNRLYKMCNICLCLNNHLYHYKSNLGMHILKQKGHHRDLVPALIQIQEASCFPLLLQFCISLHLLLSG